MTVYNEDISRRDITIQAPLTVTAPRIAPRHLSHLLLLAFTATAVLSTNHLVAFLSAGSRLALTWPIQQGAVTSEERLQYLAARPVLVTLPGTTDQPVAARDILVESPPQRHETVTYTVQPGDTLSSIAIRFGLSWETVSWANELPNVNALRIGQELTLPPIDAYPYIVKNGDILTNISQRYKSDAAEIVAANNLPSPDAIFIGQRLWLPGGRPLPPPAPVAVVASAPPVLAPAPVAESAAPVASRSGFVRPLTGLLTQYFGYGHEGVDISRPWGTPVQAAAGGQVVDARKLGYSYGWYLMIDHGNGYKTMYAHLSEFLVDYGQWVEAGQVIARVGSTGRSTGPHLHFELHVNGAPVNPLNYLP